MCTSISLVSLQFEECMEQVETYLAKTLQINKYAPVNKKKKIKQHEMRKLQIKLIRHACHNQEC